jgi:hypothetical protein
VDLPTNCINFFIHVPNFWLKCITSLETPQIPRIKTENPNNKDSNNINRNINIQNSFKKCHANTMLFAEKYKSNQQTSNFYNVLGKKDWYIYKW